MGIKAEHFTKFQGIFKTLKDHTCSNYLTYCMLARPNRPTREWHQVPGVTSTKIIRIHVFFLGLFQKNLTFWLGFAKLARYAR